MTDPTDPTAEGRPLSALDSWARMLAGAEVLAGRALLPFDQLPAGEQERHRVVARRLVEAAVVEAAPASPAPATDRTALRRIVFGAVESVFEAWRDGLGDCRPEDALTDAVLAVLPAPTDRAAVLNEAADAIDHETQQLKDHEVLEPDRYRPCRDASAQLRRMADETRQAEAGARSVPLAASCTYCGHRFDEHNRFGCCVGNQVVRCGCGAFVLSEKPVPCSARPCNPAAGELCDTHARVKYHGQGEHAFCGDECDAETQPAETEAELGCAHCGHSQARHMGDEHERGCHACWDSPGNGGWNHPFHTEREPAVEAPQDPAQDSAAETVHGCPPDGSGLTPCCGRTPFELPLSDRISSEASVTCPGPAAGAQQPKETSNPRTVCVCGHTKGEHLTVSGRLLCDACDPDSTDNLVCRGFDAL